MESEVLYKRLCEYGQENTYLEYYIIPENISAAYCDLKCYGVKIKKINKLEGGGMIIDIKEISNAFYREHDAIEFTEYLTSCHAEPHTLRYYMEKYIEESLDRAKQKA